MQSIMHIHFSHTHILCHTSHQCTKTHLLIRASFPSSPDSARWGPGLSVHGNSIPVPPKDEARSRAQEPQMAPGSVRRRGDGSGTGRRGDDWLTLSENALSQKMVASAAGCCVTWTMTTTGRDWHYMCGGQLSWSQNTLLAMPLSHLHWYLHLSSSNDELRAKQEGELLFCDRFRGLLVRVSLDPLQLHVVEIAL